MPTRTDPHKTVLVVDDDPTGRKLLSVTLEDEGYSVLAAADGVEALAILGGEQVDVVISDILMPRMDGYRLCLEVRKDKRLAGLQFIMYSGTFTATADERLALSMGVDKYVGKPAPIATLIAALREGEERIPRAGATQTLPQAESEVLREYNEALVRKLEERNVELAGSNEELRRAYERLSSLHEVDQAILKAVESPEAIAQAALRRLRGLLQCQCASVGIFDQEKHEVLVLAADCDGSSAVRTGKVLAWHAYGDPAILLQAGMVAAEDFSDLTTPPALARMLQAEGIRSSITVPLPSAQGLLGALNVGWEASRPATREEMEIAGEASAQIAIAVEQARLQEQTKRHAEELEQRVAERTAQLEAANRELEAFTYSVSHDLRAPLRAIDGYTGVLVEDYASRLDDEGRRVCGIISRSAREMGKLIDDLLAFSRIGRTAMQYSAIEMTAMTKSIFLEMTTPERRERIDLRLGPLPPACGDPNLLRQVLVNLLSNAVKFSSRRERAVIEVGGRVAGEELVYSIRDNGAGFDMRYVGKLFGVFQRLHGVKDFEGTGVGLAIVQRIVARHGGRVWAEGEPDKGATFAFALPGAPARGRNEGRLTPNGGSGHGS